MILTLEELALVDTTKWMTQSNENTVKPLIIRISTDMLCNKRSNADIAFDWLAVLMLGEYLEQLDLNPDWTTVGSMGHILAIDFTVNSAINQTALEALQAYAEIGRAHV